jgi:hypothetical protein
MSCSSCPPRSQAEFTAEINIHFPGLNNVDKPSVFVFPKILVCLECGRSRFTIPETELAQLREVEPQARHEPTGTVSTMPHPIPGQSRRVEM